METTIIKTVKGSTMEKIFNKSKVINVKNYEALNVSDTMYKPSKKYQFEIRIRHAEDTDAEALFQTEIELFEKPKKEKIVKTFLAFTELGRVKGRISFYIAEIVPNKGLRLIDNDYTCSASSHKGVESEAVQALVSKKELPITAINASGYMDKRVKNYNLIMIEGRGLNYVNQY